MIVFDRKQLKAAIALTGLMETEFADAADMRRATLSGILTGKSHPNDENLRRITDKLAKLGVELLPGGGVRPRQPFMAYYDGIDGWKQFSEDRYITALSDTREFLSCGGVRDGFITATGEDHFKMHTARMAALPHFKMRALRPLSHASSLVAPYTRYRGIPDEQFPASTFYVYGNKLAHIVHKPDIHIYVIEDAEVANSYRGQFDVLWQNARPLRDEGDHE